MMMADVTDCLYDIKDIMRLIEEAAPEPKHPCSKPETRYRPRKPISLTTLQRQRSNFVREFNEASDLNMLRTLCLKM